MEKMEEEMKKMERGIVNKVIEKVVGFRDIEKEMKRMEGREVLGKIIIKIEWESKVNDVKDENYDIKMVEKDEEIKLMDMGKRSFCDDRVYENV